MPGPVGKRADRRQGHRARAGNTPPLALVRGSQKPPPPCPGNLLKRSQAEWVRLWKLPISIIWDGGDRLVCERMIRLKDEEYRIARAIARRRVVKGSRGQSVQNPLMRRQESLWTEIRQLEDRLGLSPRARLQLGIALGDAYKSLDQLNAGIGADDGEDPRVSAGRDAVRR